MKKLKSTALIVTLFWLGILVIDCGSRKENNKDQESTATIPVEVTTGVIGDISAFYSGTTTLEAEGDARVVAKVDGIVEEIFVEEGTFVNAGDILARLQDEVYRIQLAQSEATMHRLESEYQRNKAMYQKNAVSEQVYQRSKYDYKSQKAAYELAHLNLNHTSIRAPISGIISERKIKVGNMVLANTETFRITQFDPLIAILYVPERELSKLKKNQKAILTIDAIPNSEFEGFIDRISPIVDPETGTIKVTLEVHDTTGRLKMGMFARISIIYDTHQDALLVPKDALLKEDTETAVYIIRDSLAFRKVVETGYSNSTHVEVLTGIAPLDTLVTAGQGSLKDSAVVEIIQP